MSLPWHFSLKLLWILCSSLCYLQDTEYETDAVVTRERDREFSHRSSRPQYQPHVDPQKLHDQNRAAKEQGRTRKASSSRSSSHSFSRSRSYSSYSSTASSTSGSRSRSTSSVSHSSYSSYTRYILLPIVYVISFWDMH